MLPLIDLMKENQGVKKDEDGDEADSISWLEVLIGICVLCVAYIVGNHLGNNVLTTGETEPDVNIDTVAKIRCV